MSRARDVASLLNTVATDTELDDAISAVPTGGKNLLYNGAMQVAQRGTSVTGITLPSYYTADRWSLGIGGLGTWTQTVESDSPSGSGLRNSLKMLCTTSNASPSAANVAYINQKLEGQDLQRIAKGSSGAQQLTVSFWVKSNVTGTFIVWLYDADNTRSVAASYTISASATWEKKTITFPADTTGAFDNDNNDSMWLNFWLGAGSNFTSGTLATTWETHTPANIAVGQTNLASATNNYWQVTGVQLEVGDTATEFEHLPFGVELARCQRYWEQSYALGTAGGTNTETGIVQSMNGQDGNQIAGIRWIVTKRAAPIVSIWSKTGTTSTVSNTSLNNSGANNGSWSTIAGNSVHGFRALVGTGGLTAASAYNFHYTANSEL